MLLLVVLFSACESRPKKNEASSAAPKTDPQAIVNRAIEAHGGQKFETLNISFAFRDRHYTAHRDNGLYTYTRAFTDSLGRVKDVLTNNSFSRTINGAKQALPAERVQAFTSSVNSVIYFALLPFGLNDPAVQKQYLGTATINNNSYYKIKVSFKQAGGGTDFQDKFLYYIHQKTYTMDYLAYTYATDGGGIRFRQAINPRTIGGILFQDYINYEPKAGIDFWQIEQAFAAGQLKELSRIELENIKVKSF